MTLPYSAPSTACLSRSMIPRCVHEEFEARALEAPGRTAVVTANGSISYGELNARANIVAHHLLSKTTAGDEIIGVLAGRSIETVAAFLGIMKSGRGYLALDPDYPSNRLELLIADSGAPVLVPQDDLRARIAGVDFRNLGWPTGADTFGNLGIPAALSDLAYVSYTSGSTGVPKGALLNHQGLARLISFTRKQMQIGPGDRILQFASLSFDASVWETFCALTSGATLVLGDSDSLLPGPGLHHLIRSLGVTIALLSPSVLSILPSEGLERLRIVVAGTEKCSEDIARRWSAGRRFFNAYGPTETTIYSTVYEAIGTVVGAPPIGRAIPGTEVHIVDADLAEVAPGESGELLISGEGLARGYLNRPELTEARFIVVTAAGGRRAYRTGDRCRLLPDGNIEFLGRLDRQVKIRGFRVEPGEVELALEQQKGVSSSVVVARPGASGLLELWAYVVPDAGCVPTPRSLIDALASQLPRYMLPTSIQVLQHWPLTPHKKVDVAALPPPAHETGLFAAAEWSDDFEKAIAEACAAIKPGCAVEPELSIFDLGFTSLDVARLLWEIHKSFRVSLSYTSVFKAATVPAIARLVKSANGEAHPSVICIQAPPAPLARAQGPLPALRRDGEPVWYASLVQRDLYLVGMLSGWAGTAITDNVEVRQKLDHRRLFAALHRLIARHELLRTSFEEVAGRVVQQVHDAVDIQIGGLTGDDSSAPQSVEFDPATAPLFRVSVVARSDESFRLRFDLSHLLVDGTSVELIKRDMAALYADTPLPDLPITYRDYALWQNCLVEENGRGEAAAHWAAELADGAMRIRWKEVHNHRQSARGRADVTISQLSAAQTEALKTFARAHRITTMIAVAGAYALGLHVLSGQHDITFGSVVSGRRFSSLLNVVGPFLSLVPLRVRIQHDKTVDEFFQNMRETVLDGFAYQDFEFSELYRRMALIDGSAGGLPFNTGFTMHTVRNRSTLDAYRQMSWPLDLNLEAIEHENVLELHWIFRPDMVPHDFVVSLQRAFQNIVTNICGQPNRQIGDLTGPSRCPSLNLSEVPPVDRTAGGYA